MGETRRRSVFLSFVLVAFSAVPALAQTGSIVGRVTGSDTGKPVVSAVVEAVRAGGQMAGTTYSNQDGAFRIGGLRPGVYTLKVSATGYGEHTSESVQVSICWSTFSVTTLSRIKSRISSSTGTRSSSLATATGRNTVS